MSPESSTAFAPPTNAVQEDAPAATAQRKRAKMPVVRVPANDAFLRDLKALKDALGSQSYAETIRRAIAYQMVLRELMEESRAVIVRGRNPEGREEFVTLV